MAKYSNVWYNCSVMMCLLSWPLSITVFSVFSDTLLISLTQCCLIISASDPANDYSADDIQWLRVYSDSDITWLMTIIVGPTIHEILPTVFQYLFRSLMTVILLKLTCQYQRTWPARRINGVNIINSMAVSYCQCSILLCGVALFSLFIHY
jgi:hypothetical protein